MKRFLWVAFVLVGAWDPVTKKQADVAEGNRKLADGKPAEAEKHYQKALGELGALPGVLYDLGVAHYAAAQALPPGKERTQLLESAEKELRLAGDAPETALRSSAHYSLGNTLFAEDKYKEAIEEYKKSLRLQPDREDARHNLELALAKILPPPPQSPKPDPKDRKQDPQQEQKQDAAQSQQSPSGDSKDQQQQDDEKKEPGDKNAEAGADQQKRPEGGDEQNKPAPDPRDEKAAQAQAGEPDDRDTDRKLDLLEDRSKDLQVQKAQERARQKRRGREVKDW